MLANLEPLDRWALDASASDPDAGLWAFVPVVGDLAGDGDWYAVEGMTFLGDRPPYGRLVAVIHAGGQGACNQWIDQHCDAVHDLLSRVDIP